MIADYIREREQLRVRYAKQPDEAPWVAEWQGDGWWLGNRRVDGFVGDVVSPRLEPPA